ncbi:hypothetical protein, partial [Enterobacter asburiae]
MLQTELKPLYTPSISFDDSFIVCDDFDEGKQQYSLRNEFNNLCLCWINRGYFKINKDVNIDDYLQVLQEFLMQNYDFKNIPTKEDILNFIDKEVKGYEELMEQESQDYLNILNQDGWIDDWSLNETIVYLLDKENVNNNVLQNVTKFIESHQNYALTLSGVDEPYYLLII